MAPDNEPLKRGMLEAFRKNMEQMASWQHRLLQASTPLTEDDWAIGQRTLEEESNHRYRHGIGLSNIINAFNNGAESYSIRAVDDEVVINNDMYDRIRGLSTRATMPARTVDVTKLTADELVALRHKIKKELYNRGEI